MDIICQIVFIIMWSFLSIILTKSLVQNRKRMKEVFRKGWMRDLGGWINGPRRLRS